MSLQDDLKNQAPKGAIMSPDGLYRYRLWRFWDLNPKTVTFIMLNPSTANSHQDDPTVRKCIAYAKSWGFTGLYIVNLFALRATDPQRLLVHPDPVGPFNLDHIQMGREFSEVTIAAWGNSKIIKRLKPRLPSTKGLSYLELAKDGTPKHPLYLYGNLKPKSWTQKI
jgi:hypothetical protein